MTQHANLLLASTTNKIGKTLIEFFNVFYKLI